MYKFNNILVGIDIDHYQGEALEYAIHLADRNKAKLYVMYVCPHYHQRMLDLFADMDNPIDRAHAEVAEQLSEKCKKLVPEGVNYEVILIDRKHRSTYPHILETATEKDIDLIVLGEHDKDKFEPILLGSNAEKVVRYAPCSVIVIKSKKKESN